MSLVQTPAPISEILASRENNLNALRLIAAVLVLFSHSYPLSGNIQQEPIGRHLHIFDGGALAVIAFFFLSGYLISASWASLPHFPSFMAKRALRILPGLAVVATISALLLGPLMSSLDINHYFQSGQALRYIRDSINVLSLQTSTLPGVFENLPLPHAVNGSLWTLKVEFLVYIATGIVGATCLLPTAGKGWHSIFFSIIALYLVSRLIAVTPAEWNSWNTHLNFFACQLAAVFMLGILGHAVRHWLLHSWLAMAALAGLTYLLRETSLFLLFIYLTYGYFLLLIASSSFPLLGKKIRVHDYSFGVYIYAFPIQQTLIALMPGLSPLQLFLAASPIVMLFAVASWHFVEKPCLGFKPSFAK